MSISTGLPRLFGVQDPPDPAALRRNIGYREKKQKIQRNVKFIRRRKDENKSV